MARKAHGLPISRVIVLAPTHHIYSFIQEPVLATTQRAGIIAGIIGAVVQLAGFIPVLGCIIAPLGLILPRLKMRRRYTACFCPPTSA